MSNDSTKKMIIVALGVCLVCSILVSTAAVTLSARQERNKELDKIRNILVAGELLQEDQDVREIFQQKIESELVNLETGEYVPESEYTELIDPTTFSVKEVLDSREYSTFIPPEQDIADINKMPKVMSIYMVTQNDSVQKYILPIYGKGLWSTLYGFIALSGDLKTVEGITFYEHGETPGLGGEVDNPGWKSIWKGKKVFRESGEVGLTVVKGQVDEDDPNSQYKIDGLSGSTLTTRGLDTMVKFWLGENGYGPFFERLKNQQEETDEQI